jgi:hypothetical protein
MPTTFKEVAAVQSILHIAANPHALARAIAAEQFRPTRKSPMGLSNENQPQAATTEAYTFALDAMKAARLASQLIKYEHNPDPRELPNPAHPGATRVRTLSIESTLIPMRVRVSQSCAEHNSRVSSHGAVEQYEHTWKGRR